MKIIPVTAVFIALLLAIAGGDVSQAKFSLPKKCTLKQGQTKRLVSAKKARKCKFTSTDPDIAKIKKNGVLKAKLSGNCQVIVKYKKKKYVCKVHVRGKPAGGFSVYTVTGTIVSVEDKADCRVLKMRVTGGFGVSSIMDSEVTVILRGNVYKKDAYSGSLDDSINVAGRIQPGGTLFLDVSYYFAFPDKDDKAPVVYEFDAEGICQESRNKGKCYLVVQD